MFYTIVSENIIRQENALYLLKGSLVNFGESFCAYRIHREKAHYELSKEWCSLVVPQWVVFKQRKLVAHFSKTSSRYGGESMNILKWFEEPLLIAWIKEIGRRKVDENFEKLSRLILKKFHEKDSDFVEI
jgi:hypothetical protein